MAYPVALHQIHKNLPKIDSNKPKYGTFAHFAEGAHVNHKLINFIHHTH